MPPASCAKTIVTLFNQFRWPRLVRLVRNFSRIDIKIRCKNKKKSSDQSSNPSETPSSDPSEIPSGVPSNNPSETPSSDKKTCEASNLPTTYEVCCGQGPTRRLSESEGKEEIVDNAKDEEEPWTAPNQPMAELIAKNPGIWKIPDFIDPNLVQRMLETFENDERFDRCN